MWGRSRPCRRVVAAATTALAAAGAAAAPAAAAPAAGCPLGCACRVLLSQPSKGLRGLILQERFPLQQQQRVVGSFPPSLLYAAPATVPATAAGDTAVGWFPSLCSCSRFSTAAAVPQTSSVNEGGAAAGGARAAAAGGAGTAAGSGADAASTGGAGAAGAAGRESCWWLQGLLRWRLGRRSWKRQLQRQRDQEKEKIVRLPLGVSVALEAPIPCCSRLKRDVLLNAAAALLLFAASDVMAQHLQHTQAHKLQQQQQQQQHSQQQQQQEQHQQNHPRLQHHHQQQQQQECGAAHIPPPLSSTLRQLDMGRTVAVGLEGVIVNALLLTPMYHKLEAMLAHNNAPLKRSSRSSRSNNSKGVTSGRLASGQRMSAAATVAGPGAASTATAAAAAAVQQQRMRASRMLWLLSFYQVLAVQIVAMPFSSFSFLFMTPLLRFACSKVFKNTSQQQQQQQARLEAGGQQLQQQTLGQQQLQTQPQPEQHEEQQQQEQQQQQALRCWASSAPATSCWAAVVEGAEAVRCHFREIYVASLIVWPLSDLINFRFVPLALRPAWDSLLDFVWAVYLSYAAHSAPAPLLQQEQQIPNEAAAGPTGTAAAAAPH
ncbi:mpv17 / PMP22 family domain-containing protein, putative [Eimeria maxima]|uniref:Mpv17 / PMP22 family domain-containing protein, putative n=1 Tax=Eimeria maxima TaxID=5804 RepID=U6M9L9_EIMMA|nr:mpv17 / PMP22 family domain-containing protein, putative [Eimeria maxima]CDJ60716.1 mpv17 / PMP22 family domain-containing protein, putative [Eimeria maxima]